MITKANAKRYLQITDKSCSISGNGSLATVTMEDHGIKTGDQVEIASSTVSGFNGVQTVTRLSANQFTFASATNGTATALVAKYDFILDLLVSGVEHAIENYTGVKWEESATFSNKIIDCPADGIIYLPHMPLATVSAVVISRERDFTDTTLYTTLESTDFLVYEDQGRLELLGSAAESVFGTRKSVKVSYTTTTLPSALKLAAYQLLAYYFRTWNAKAENLQSRTNEGEQIVFSKEIPKDIKEILDPFRRVAIGGVDPRAARPTYF